VCADEDAGATVQSILFQERVGGRVVEVASDGQEIPWADVLAWDPPRRFVLSWHPARNPDAASRLEVRFRAVGDGTEVLLEHGGWEEFADRAEQLRRGYHDGWDAVLALFTEAADT
jgi:uncharacterized protein YndB with AHSA1/START domain